MFGRKTLNPLINKDKSKKNKSGQVLVQMNQTQQQKACMLKKYISVYINTQTHTEDSAIENTPSPTSQIQRGSFSIIANFVILSISRIKS